MARVLLVEDDDLIHRLLCDLIQGGGHTPDCARTKAEALGLLAPASHSLAIIDIVLPDGSGRDVAIRAAELGVKAILMTGDPVELELLAVVKASI